MYGDLPKKMLSSKLIANYQHTNEKPLFTIFSKKKISEEENCKAVKTSIFKGFYELFWRHNFHRKVAKNRDFYVFSCKKTVNNFLITHSDNTTTP